MTAHLNPPSERREEKKQALMKLPVLHRYLRGLHLGVLQGHAGRGKEGRKRLERDWEKLVAGGAAVSRQM